MSSKKIALIETKSPSQKRLHTNIFNSANQFLQLNMFSLQLLPKPKKDGVPGMKSSASAPEVTRPLPAIPDHTRRTSVNPQSRGSRWISYLFSNESSPVDESPKSPGLPEDVLTHLEILHEQKAQLEGFLADATRKRKFEDIKTLQDNLNDVIAELDRLRLQVEKSGYG
jgi:hypothetical protein